MQPLFRLASIFSNHMVLCWNRNIRIFGEAHTGVCIMVSIYDHTASAVAVKGKFEIILPPMAAGGPYEMNVNDGFTALTFTDILIGDVYFAGGQSNMEMQLNKTANGNEYAAAANYPDIRYFNFPVQAVPDEETLQKER